MTAVVSDEPAPFVLKPGRTPLLISFPHIGTWLPPALEDRLVPRAADREDTDWHLDRLYAFAADQGAGLLMPAANRWLVDLNRPADDTPMYTAANTTGLCPVRFFTGDALYRPGEEPGAAEQAERVQRWWRPYHEALHGELQRLRAAHGHAVLFDAHSIRSELPWLFEGTLPHLNLGTADGLSCAPGLQAALADVLATPADGEPRFSHVVNGRFKGGHITRHYGQPHADIHAVQLEMSWRTYMDESPPAWNDERAAQATPVLRRLVQALIDWRPQ